MKYIRKIITFSLIALLATVSAAQVQGEQEIKWETYHDKHGWSINYPSDWKIYKKGERIPGTKVELPKGSAYFSKGGINLSVALEELFLPITLEEWVSIAKEKLKLMLKERGLDLLEVVSEQETKIDGEPAIQITYLGGKSSEELRIKQVLTTTIKDSIAWTIACTADSAVYDLVNEVYFEPMMQSFKFEAL